MKINVFLSEIGLSERVWVILQYVQYLLERGHRVICYYPLFGSYTGRGKIVFSPGNMLKWLESKNMRKKWFESRVEIRHPIWINDINVEDADIAIATTWMTAYWVDGLSSQKGKKIYFIQGPELNKDEKRFWKAYQSYNLSMDSYITVSAALSKILSVKNKITATVICNGIYDKELRLVPRTINNKMVIGFSYRSGKNKNYSRTIKILKHVLEKEDIVVASYGTEKPPLWPSGWRFIENPSRAELYDFYDYADIFYASDLYEKWGLSAMEAMGHGCAVVSADNGIINEMGVDGVNCIKVLNPQDAVEVEEKILGLIRNKELTRKIGETARIKVISENNYKLSCEKFEKVLIRTIAEGYIRDGC